jgi:hypothetical protein
MVPGSSGYHGSYCINVGICLAGLGLICKSNIGRPRSIDQTMWGRNPASNVHMKAGQLTTRSIVTLGGHFPAIEQDTMQPAAGLYGAWFVSWPGLA